MPTIYDQYGRLMIELEILNSKIAQVKQQIAQELNSKTPVEPKEGE